MTQQLPSGRKKATNEYTNSWPLLLRAVTLPFFFVGGCKWHSNCHLAGRKQPTNIRILRESSPNVSSHLTLSNYVQHSRPLRDLSHHRLNHPILHQCLNHHQNGGTYERANWHQPARHTNGNPFNPWKYLRAGHLTLKITKCTVRNAKGSQWTITGNKLCSLPTSDHSITAISCLKGDP